MNEELAEFIDQGYCHGLKNGHPIVLSFAEGGHARNAGNSSFLKHMREYERRKGTARSYRDQQRRLIRADVAEAWAKKRASA